MEKQMTATNSQMKFQITNIKFDLDPGDNSIPEYIQEKVQLELQEEYIDTIWDADNGHDDLVEEITCASGWGILEIDYVYALS